MYITYTNPMFKTCIHVTYNMYIYICYIEHVYKIYMLHVYNIHKSHVQACHAHKFVSFAVHNKKLGVKKKKPCGRYGAHKFVSFEFRLQLHPTKQLYLHLLCIYIYTYICIYICTYIHTFSK